MGTTLKDVQILINELMNTQWDFEDLYGGPRSLNIVKDLGYTFKFDNSKNRFGCCAASRSNSWDDIKRWISLSKPLCALNLDKLNSKIKDTILHEIAHALTISVKPHSPSHGRLWEHIAKQIGCKAERTFDSSEVTMTASKYTLTCPSCGRESGMHKRPKREKACGICCKKYNNGRFSPDYIMTIKQNY